MTAALAAIVATAAAIVPASGLAQLPPPPTPVPGSLLDRPVRPVSPQASPSEPGQPGATPAPQARRVAFGTAFRIDAAGHLVTNRHVVENCKAIGIVTGNRAAGNLKLVAIDPRHDLALLVGPPASPGQGASPGSSASSAASAAQAATLRASDEPVQGEDVLVYGFPLPGMLSSSGQLGAGMVTALTGIRNDADQLQVDAPLQSGNSGGPLMDRRGQVIGVVFAKLNALRVAQITGDLPQNVNFAVRLAPLKRLLDANGVRYLIGPPDGPELSNQQVAAMAREWTVPIACQRE